MLSPYNLPPSPRKNSISPDAVGLLSNNSRSDSPSFNVGVNPLDSPNATKFQSESNDFHFELESMYDYCYENAT
jgi:hypothetical protein